ncbi:unnamed protein product [Heterosigma akashiwo]
MEMMCGPLNILGNLFGGGGSSPSGDGSIFDFTVKDATGKDVNLGSTYKGKKNAFLIVNVASK